MALSLSSKTYLTTTTPWRSLSRLLAFRAQSNTPNHLADISEESSTTDPLLRKLEDAIHRIIVRRAAPDWLPFLPGSSYWVPPPRSTGGSLGIAQLVEKLANPLTDEQSLSTTTVRGWPSSDFFFQDASPRTIEVKMTSNKFEDAKPTSNKSEVEAISNIEKVEAPSNYVSPSEEEEG
ncbi:uncharacterized protein LOC8259965 [Ricinus communis]|uniref:Uncharacterized protein n=1 Tax=Ricinus communis TaxID=3988 RepID=B9RHV5_RICCO|nr:uncharacterized protein LOC8259965 [Ricinus communis]XP_015571249.1 uncharacterized protein LOC8259965 [Ricinus communis]EEF48727.1 conserved hypothetical protein [Ricinus communis]|eukprot:XP_015571248.1 uncharacterized protein LOC8259965 [Ricinus communis]